MSGSKTIFAVLFLVSCGIVALMFSSGQTHPLGLLSKKGFTQDEESWNEFTSFIKTHNKTYASVEELQMRYQIFHQNHYWIKVQNQRVLGTTYAHNQFSDLTNEEFRNTYLGLKVDMSQRDNFAPVEYNVELPDSVDWEAQGVVTGIKNQGQCGSCWAFSAVGALEGAYKQKTGQLQSFSEQQLVDCTRNYGNYGCGGGWWQNAFKYWQSVAAETESQYPYTAQDGTCKQGGGITKLSSYANVQTNEYALKTAASQRVVSVGVDASQWAYYSGGIYQGACNSYVDHGVTLVGYGIENGNKYWKIKNSWGNGWGEGGHIRLQRTDSTSAGGQCLVATTAAYPVL